MGLPVPDKQSKHKEKAAKAADWRVYMKDLFLDMFFPEKKYETPPNREDFLKKALQEAKQSLDDAYLGLQNVNDPDLIDRYIYELNAANLRYKVLLQDIKSCEPVSPELEMPDRISSTNLDTSASLLNRSFR